MILVCAAIVGWILTLVLAWFEGKWIGERNVLREWTVDLKAQAAKIRNDDA